MEIGLKMAGMFLFATWICLITILMINSANQEYTQVEVVQERWTEVYRVEE